MKREGESYEKEFLKEVVGVWELDKGTGSLRLAVSKLNGDQFADIKAIELELLK